MVLKIGKLRIAVLHKNRDTILTKEDASKLNYVYGSMKAYGESEDSSLMKRIRSLINTYL